MKIFYILFCCYFVLTYSAPHHGHDHEHKHDQHERSSKSNLEAIVDRAVNAKVEQVLVNLLKYWRESSGVNSDSMTGMLEIPDHGHQESHSHSNDDITGTDPEHKPDEVFQENFEQGTIQVDKKPIVPIIGDDH